jgi:hypothetical protein
MLRHLLRASRESQIRLKSPFDGKIDGSCVPGPGGVSSLRPDHLTNNSDEAAKEIPRKRITFAAARPLAGLNSPVRGLRHRIAFKARPVACGLALIRRKGKANPA